MIRLTKRLGLALVAGLSLSSAADAALFRAYLSLNGNDANPCTLQQPCRLLPAALTAVAANGEIWMLDSANYNTDAVFVNKSVTIQAIPGQMGSIVSVGTGNYGVMVSSSTAKITFRNIAFSTIATQPGSYGIYVSTAAVVTAEDCTFANFPGMAYKQLDAGTASYFRNTVFRNNAVAISTEGGKTTVANSQFFANDIALNAYGFLSGQSAYIAVSDSMISGSIDHAVKALSEGANTTTRVSLTRSTIQNSSFGITADSYAAGGTSVVTLANSTVTGNGIAFVISTSPTQSSIKSLGNNYIADNGNDGTGLVTTPLR
jgi:hypothetical protein